MLYEILAVILVLYAALSPFWVIKCVKFGIKCADDPEKAAEEPDISIPWPEKKAVNVELTPEQQRYVDIMTNIDTYDGTEVGQKEIK